MVDCCRRTCSRYISQNCGFCATSWPGASTSSEASVAWPSRIACAADRRSLFSPGVENGIEREVLTLERMDQLVGQHQAELGAVRALYAEERGGVRIVEARDLLGVEIDQQRPELQRVG